MPAPHSTTMQFRIDPELKHEAEALFHDLGTSFAEALRIFARQRVLSRSMPFPVALPQKETASGVFASYADPAKRTHEAGAFARAMEAKHANAR